MIGRREVRNKQRLTMYRQLSTRLIIRILFRGPG